MDFVNENIELVRKLSFSIQLSDPDDYDGGNLQLMDELTKLHLPTTESMVSVCLILEHNTEFLK